MKKAIVICVFLLLIFATVSTTLNEARESYYYDMDPQNGVDLFEGVGAFLTLMVGGLVVFYELDLFCTTYYFVVMQKSIAKTILNVLSNFSLVLIFVNNRLSNNFMELRAYEAAQLVLLSIYVVLRMAFFVVESHFSNCEEETGPQV